MPKTGPAEGPTTFQPKAQSSRDRPEPTGRPNIIHKSKRGYITQKGVRKVIESDVAEENHPSKNSLDNPVKESDTKLSPKVVAAQKGKALDQLPGSVVKG